MGQIHAPSQVPLLAQGELEPISLGYPHRCHCSRYLMAALTQFVKYPFTAYNVLFLGRGGAVS
eukprot:c11948_g1_i1 orf=45-233(-)